MQKKGEDTSGFYKKCWETSGICGLFQGWKPTLIGYSFQGFFKFGLYEMLKYTLFIHFPFLQRKQFITFMIASGFAEWVADFFLVPFETIKLTMQRVKNREPSSLSMVDAIKEIHKEKGLVGFFEMLPKLWLRQIIHTIVKFISFEYFLTGLFILVFLIFKKKRNNCSKILQSFLVLLAGFMAGILCAVITQPFDTLISKNENIEGKIFSWSWFCNAYAGLPLRILMVGSLTGCQWLIYDFFKIITGAKSLIPRKIIKKN